MTAADRRRISPLAAIFLTVFVDLVGFGIIVPLLPFYGEHFHASPAVVTLLMAIYSLMQFFSAPIWGALSDRRGRKPVLLASLAGIALSYLWLAFAGSLWQLFAARALAGVMAGNIAAAQAYIADVTPPDKRAHGMGLIGAAFGLGFILGPAIGGLLGGANPAAARFVGPGLAAAGLSLLALIFASVALPESLDAARRSRLAATRRPSRISSLARGLADPHLRLTVILLFLVTFVFAGMESVFALWSERSFGWGPAQNGYVFAYTGILAALVQGGLIRRLARRFGEAHLVMQGAVALGLGLAAIALVHSLLPLLVAMALLAYGQGVSNPSLSSLISLAAPEDEQGATLGISQAAASLARILGPILAGIAFTLLGRDGPFLAGALVMLCVLLLAWRLPRRRGGESRPSGAEA
jgi:DHA1 family tetracycline resistance protein-like MFS transporter